MEYNYAMDKGIPVLVVSLDESVEVEKEETDDIKKGKLAEFKNRAMKNRLASFWSNPSDLAGKVAVSIMRAQKEINRPGWRRGNSADNKDLLEQILILQNENSNLKEKLALLDGTESEIDLSKLFYEKEITLEFTEKVYIFTENTRIDEQTITTTLSNLFKFISLRLTGINTINTFEDEVSAYKSGYTVSRQDALKVRNLLEQINLIESYIDEDGVEKLTLTDFGKDMMNKLNNE